MCKRRKLVLLLSLLCVLSLTSVVLAQTGFGRDLSWHVIAAGGGTSEGFGRVVIGTIGQPVAGVSTLNNTVNSGFWYTRYYRIFLPVILKG